jgi:cyclophilin family peptidyl-prolyl cis-trans isomerase
VSEQADHNPGAAIEPLEARLLMRAARPTQVLGAWFDNRGTVQLNMSVGIDTSTLSRKTAAIWVTGTDNVLGTADDLRLYTAVGYRRGVITLRAATALNQTYRVILNASVIKDTNGLALDGEFNGDGKPSGNGYAGGNFDIVTSIGSKYRARFNTILGNMTVSLYNNTPQTKANFFHFANEASWDGTVFHRSVRISQTSSIDIVQAGGFYVGGSDNIVHTVHTHDGVPLELGNSNVRGTIAMARTDVLNSATNQWFFNVGNNTGLDTNNGGYAVFGIATDAESLHTIDALAAMPTGTVNNYTPDAPYTGQQFPDVPVLNVAAIQARGQISPKDDYAPATRVAILFNPSATPAVGVKRAIAAEPASPVAPPGNPFLVLKREKNPVL